jgi:hypothetical protein
MAGDIKWVRAPGPCRPPKLRLVVDAQRSPGGTTSPLIPTHMEQPECLAQIFRARRVRLARRIRYAGVDRQGILRARAPGNNRRNVGGVVLDLAVELRAFVRR